MALQIDLAGRVALVTGGARGVGRGIAERFLAAGAEVAVCGRATPTSVPTVDGRSARFFTANVRQADQVTALMLTLTDRYGRLDVLVNNAGGSPPAEAASASDRFSSAIVDLNLLAALTCAQRANALMQTQADGGVIVNIGSVSGLRPSPGTAAYGAAKAGLVSLTRSLAMEWAPKVRVNCVAPGLVLTEDSHDHYGGAAGVGRVAATVPLGRFGEPAEVGDACVFLASPMAAYVSGAVLAVHGGGEPPAFLSAANPSSQEP